METTHLLSFVHRLPDCGLVLARCLAYSRGHQRLASVDRDAVELVLAVGPYLASPPNFEAVSQPSVPPSPATSIVLTRSSTAGNKPTRSEDQLHSRRCCPPFPRCIAVEMRQKRSILHRSTLVHVVMPSFDDPSDSPALLLPLLEIALPVQ